MPQIAALHCVCGIPRMAIGKFYCGLEELVWFGLGAGTGSAVGGAVWDVVGIDCARGASGPVIMALSGLSRWSLLGPNPSLIRARESGTVLLCQP